MTSGPSPSRLATWPRSLPCPLWDSFCSQCYMTAGHPQLCRSHILQKPQVRALTL